MSLRTQSTPSENDVPVSGVMAPHPTVAVSRDESTTRERDGIGAQPSTVRRDMGVSAPAIGLMSAAVLALLLSAWAALVPFIGPTFGFSADGTLSWTWNRVHLFGAVVPGAVGVLACILILASAGRAYGFWNSAALRMWGFALFLCGAWLTVVPVVWPAIVGRYFHAASASMTLAHWLAYSSGPGVLLAGFGAFVIGRASSYRAAQMSVP